MVFDSSIDEKYMRRCLQLARNGRQNAAPNPMVGAVIVAENGLIIGEGYHRHFGEAHAEVNAFASVKPQNEALLSKATVYVSLEPCSHFGKTPPCADLIISKGVRRVVCGCLDPFPQVSGNGVKRMREAGIRVDVGVLEKECLALNRTYITFQTKHRPYIILKWAQTANGFIDKEFKTLHISNPFTRMLCHKMRAENDAILVGKTTEERERPALTVRHWAVPTRTHLPEGISTPMRLVLTREEPLPRLMERLYNQQVQSLIVEGGAKTHKAFLDAGLWDEIRVETAPFTVESGTAAPQLPRSVEVASVKLYDGNYIVTYLRSEYTR